jgi:Protein of unknown function (DUF3810)
MRIVRLIVILLAFAGAVAPFPPTVVDAWYSRGFFPAIQTTVTPITNAVPFALLDVAAIAVLIVIVVRLYRSSRRVGVPRALLFGVVPLVTFAAAAYLVFLLMWGFNYRRVPLEERLQFDRGRITHDAVRRLGENAARMLNTTYDLAHAPRQDGPALDAAFAAAQRMLGAQRLAGLGVPKASLLHWYFRKAAIDGMTDPFFLEVIVNPDVLPFERPFVLAHEWGHLAGYASEDEANLIAWIACLQGDALARYSGWLAVYEHASGSLPRADRVALAKQLAPGPRADLEASAARFARSSPVVRTAARDVYDSYLRANRVEEGIESYTAVVRLIVGAGMEEGQAPRLRGGA